MRTSTVVNLRAEDSVRATCDPSGYIILMLNGDSGALTVGMDRGVWDKVKWLVEREVGLRVAAEEAIG